MKYISNIFITNYNIINKKQYMFPKMSFMDDKENRQILISEKLKENVRNKGVLKTDTGIIYNCTFDDCVRIFNSSSLPEKYSGNCVRIFNSSSSPEKYTGNCVRIFNSSSLPLYFSGNCCH